jgi:hypothetical protein
MQTSQASQEMTGPTNFLISLPIDLVVASFALFRSCGANERENNNEESEIVSRAQAFV